MQFIHSTYYAKTDLWLLDAGGFVIVFIFNRYNIIISFPRRWGWQEGSNRILRSVDILRGGEARNICLET